MGCSMKISHVAISCAIMAITMAAAAPVFAEDGKALTGSACQASFSSGVQSLFRNGASISSSGSQPVSVTCPVTKDIEAGRIKRAEVMVVDRNPGSNADISCTLTTHKKDGSVHQSSTRKSNSSFTATLPLSFGAQTAALQGSYSLICDLPPIASVPGNPNVGPSSIVMYNVVEE